MNSDIRRGRDFEKYKYIDEHGSDEWVMVQMSDREWHKPQYLGRAYGWATKNAFLGDEHPSSKKSTPIRVLTVDEFNNILEKHKPESIKE